MTDIFSFRGNHYIKTYNKTIPVYPQKKDITIHKTNGIYNTYFKCYKDRIPKLQELAYNLPFIPVEIWCVILEYLMYIEKKDKKQYDRWLYSDYSKTPMPGIKLRTRQLYLPNIYGIAMNEGYNIINCAERSLNHSGIKKKKIIENLSKYFLNYIIKWFHWLNIVAYHEGYPWEEQLIFKYCHFIYTLKLKSNYFMDNEQTDKYTVTAYRNFYCAQYFINTYYPASTKKTSHTFFRQDDADLSYKDIDFEYYIFDNYYYNNVYKKAMKLRNYKRINIFLH